MADPARVHKAARPVALLAFGAFVAYLRPPRGSGVYGWNDKQLLFTEGPEPWLALAVGMVAAGFWANALWRLRKDETPEARQQRRRKDGATLAKLGFQIAIPLLAFAVWVQSSANAIVWDFEVAYLIAVVTAGGGWALYHSFQHAPVPPVEALPSVEDEAPASTPPTPPPPPPRPAWAVRCIALGLLLPIAVGSIAAVLLLAGDRRLQSFSDAVVFPTFGLGMVLVVAGLAGLALRRVRIDAEARREAETALGEAMAEADADPDTPSVLLDAPTGLPWERGR